MVTPRPLRLPAALTAAVLVGWALLGGSLLLAGSLVLPGSTALAAPAEAAAAPATTTTTAPPAPTTTTSTTVAPTTTVPPPSTTTTTVPASPASTTTTVPPAKGSPPVTGVPSVPTGGPPTTTPAPGKPAPPVDVGPSVAAVNTDLAQLDAIGRYGSVKAAVAAAKAKLVAAEDGVAAAQRVAAGVAARQARAAAQLATAKGHMAGLALAAYTGEAYAGPSSPQRPTATGTVSSPGGVNPTEVPEEQVLLGLVVQQTEDRFSAARKVVEAADEATTAAAARVARARSAAGAATGAVARAQAALVAAGQAATVAGAAAAQAAAGPEGAQLTSATSPSMSEAAAQAAAPTILGPTLVRGPELAAWFTATGRKANTTVPIGTLAADYVAAARQTGVRGDLAFAQSIIETGSFSFPAGGQLTAADNNFAGIGACDSCQHGWSFPSALVGVTAQEELLEAYASPGKVATPLIGPVGVGGCCTTWVALAGKWATSKTYGVEILTVYKQILDWVIPQRLLAAGLVPPGSVTPAPPGTEASGPAGPVATRPTTSPAGAGRAPATTSPAAVRPATTTTVPLAPVAGR